MRNRCTLDRQKRRIKELEEQVRSLQNEKEIILSNFEKVKESIAIKEEALANKEAAVKKLMDILYKLIAEVKCAKKNIYELQITQKEKNRLTAQEFNKNIADLRSRK